MLFAEYDSDLSSWVAPFVMAMINERVVHRSHALSNHRYGEDFQHNEGTLTGAGVGGCVRAVAIALGVFSFGVGAAIGPARKLIQRFLLPKPGKGPSQEAQLAGSLDIRFVGRRKEGQTLHVKVAGDRDPGYGSTAKMLGQAVISLACDYRNNGTKT